MKVSEMKISELKDSDVLRGELALAQTGILNKDEILDTISDIEKKIEEINAELADVESGLEAYINFGDSADPKRLREIADSYGTQVDLQEREEELKKTRTMLSDSLTAFEKSLENYKNFNKILCFSNIRHLLKENPEIKVGQIEKEAGVRLGYISRLEKPDNTSEPSIEVVVSAAKLLGVSIDTLLTVDLTTLTPTEQYLVRFIDKLKADTLADKLGWEKETDDYLNRIESEMNGNPNHPLLSYQVFWRESETEYPDQVEEYVLVSNAFGPNTCFNGDSFNLRMKNGSILYIVSIAKDVHYVNDASAFAKEVWMYKPMVGTQFLFGTKDGSALAQMAETLYQVVSDRNKHPKIKKELKSVIDAFMNDDFTDDPEKLPFD